MLKLSLLFNLCVIGIIAICQTVVASKPLHTSKHEEVTLAGFELSNPDNIEITVFDLLNNHSLGKVEPTAVAKGEVKFNIKTGVYIIAINENDQTLYSDTINVTSFRN